MYNLNKKKQKEKEYRLSSVGVKLRKNVIESPDHMFSALDCHPDTSPFLNASHWRVKTIGNIRNV